MKTGYRAVGTVREIWRYPVKSMAGEMIADTKLGWNGLAGDRRYAFNRVGNKSGLPFLSAREAPRLILYRPVFRNPGDVDHSGIDVTTPAGASLDLYAAELRTELEAVHDGPLEVLSLWRGSGTRGLRSMRTAWRSGSTPKNLTRASSESSHSGTSGEELAVAQNGPFKPASGMLLRTRA